MAKYAKPRETRTMRRGLRPLPPQLPDNFSQKAIEEMAERIEKILTDNRILNEKANWIIAQALLVVSFRQASTDEDRNKITREINRHENEGRRFGFKEKQIRALNRLVTQKDQPEQPGQLESFRQRLSARREN